MSLSDGLGQAAQDMLPGRVPEGLNRRPRRTGVPTTSWPAIAGS